MWKKSKLVLLSGTLAFAVTCNATNYVAFAANNESTVTNFAATTPSIDMPINQNYVKIMFDNRVLFHEQVPTKTIIQVLDVSGDVLESEVLSGDMKIELDNPKVSDGKMLSYWLIEKKDNKLLIRPVEVQEKELPVKLLSTEGGHLLQHNAQTKEIVKSVNKGTNLKDILPDVNPEKHYKFAGWFKIFTTEDNKEVEEKINIDDVKITDAASEYYAKFYPDFNNNNIDDRTEEITIKFVTNSEETFNDFKMHVGQQVKLPILQKKDSVFMGWYTDEAYKNKVNSDGILIQSQTLYAKWEKIEKVIEEVQNKPITDKDFSDQIERILKERLQNRNNSNVTQTPNGNGNLVQRPNNNTTSRVTPNDSNNPGVIVVNPSNPSKPPNPSTEGAKGSAFTETKYVFANSNIDDLFMVKFFEKDGRFLFSQTLPYGKTVKVYDQNEKLREEYAIRQNTTITLDTKDYVKEGFRFLNFDSREVHVNSMQITEIFPQTKIDSEVGKKIAAEQQALASKQEEKSSSLIFLVLFLVVAATGIGSYLYIQKRRRQIEE